MAGEFERAARARLVDVKREIDGLEPEALQYHQHLVGFLLRFEADYPEGARLAMLQVALERETGKPNHVKGRRG